MFQLPFFISEFKIMEQELIKEKWFWKYEGIRRCFGITGARLRWNTQTSEGLTMTSCREIPLGWNLFKLSVRHEMRSLWTQLSPPNSTSMTVPLCTVSIERGTRSLLSFSGKLATWPFLTEKPSKQSGSHKLTTSRCIAPEIIPDDAENQAGWDHQWPGST